MMMPNLANESLTPYLESASTFLKAICDRLLFRKLRKAELVKGLARFDYCILFKMPQKQAALCYCCFYNSFFVQGWVPKEVRPIHVEEYMDLGNSLSYGFVSNDGSGSENEDLITFLCGCLELCCQTKTLTRFRLSCPCVSQSPISLPSVQFGWAVTGSEGPEVAEIIELVQSHMLLHNAENKNFTDTESYISCVELLETSAGTVLQSEYVDTHDIEKTFEGTDE